MIVEKRELLLLYAIYVFPSFEWFLASSLVRIMESVNNQLGVVCEESRLREGGIAAAPERRNAERSRTQRTGKTSEPSYLGATRPGDREWHPG